MGAFLQFLPMLLAAGGALAENAGGKNNARQSSTYNKGQLSAIDNILNQIKGMGGQQDITQNQGYQAGKNWLSDLFNDENFFNKFEAPLQRQFQEQTVPELANRFGSMGSGGSLGSTGFRNQLAREGSNLSTNIAALRGGMQQQGVNQQLQYAQQPFQNLLGLMQQALQPTQNVFQPANQGFFGPILSSLAGGYAQGYGQKLGNQFAGQYAGTS